MSKKKEGENSSLLDDIRNSDTVVQLIGSKGNEDKTGVTGRWFDSVKQNAKGWNEIGKQVTLPDGSKRDPTGGEKVARVIRATQQSVGAVMSLINMPLDMLNVGFATLTNGIAQMYGQQPANTLGGVALTIPHFHTPPRAGFVPLPSTGPMILAGCWKVLINSFPAARTGDLAYTPTCLSMVSWYKQKFGSSNVFIGGERAARLYDPGMACGFRVPKAAEAVAKVADAAADAAKKVEKGFAVAGVVAGTLGIAADIAEAAVEDDAAHAAAKALSALTNSVQMAADAAAMAAGSIPQEPGAPPAIGMVLGQGTTVMIGGFPMFAFPNPAQALLKKLATLRARKKQNNADADQVGTTSCKI